MFKFKVIKNLFKLRKLDFIKAKIILNFIITIFSIFKTRFFFICLNKIFIKVLIFIFSI